jgi:predicted dehydrogenase
VKVFDHGVDRMDPDELRRSYRAGDIHAPHIAPTEALQLEVRDFIDSARRGRRPLSDGAFGLRVVRVLAAAMRSLRRDGERVPYREAVPAR